MNSLPKDRRVIHGRTWSRTYYPSDMDPIQHHRRARNGPGGWMLAVAMGIVGAAFLFVFL